MRLELLDDAEAVAVRAEAWLASWQPPRKEPILVMPTGGTPVALYRRLVKAHEEGRFGFGDARFVALDEYLGCSRDDPRSLANWLRSKLLDPMGVPRERLVAFDPLAEDVAAECRRVEHHVRSFGSIDLLVLGLGSNGHLGFNEPGSPLDGPTHVVELTEESIRTNTAHWGSEDEVPRRAITLGLGTFELAREVVLLVTGSHKAAILAKALQGPVGPDVPATWLQGRANVTVLADRAAAGLLQA